MTVATIIAAPSSCELFGQDAIGHHMPADGSMMAARQLEQRRPLATNDLGNFAPHARTPSVEVRDQGSMASNVLICASDNPAMTGWRQPVVRKMWMASGREGSRTPPAIMLA